MFLATTALSDFWDTSQDILFLGSWCQRHANRAEWEGLKYQTMPSPWNDRVLFHAAAEYLDASGERMLVKLSDYLNSIHGLDKTQRYWRILIGPWLRQALHVTYDRYAHLKQALSLYPNLDTILLAEQSYRVPSDTDSFVLWSFDDPYNLQLFSQLLIAMGHTFPTRALEYTWDTPAVETTAFRRKLLKSAYALFQRGIGHVLSGAGRAILFDTYCPRGMVWKLALRTRFRALPFESSVMETIQRSEAIFDQRRQGLARLKSEDEFENLFVRLLPMSLPTVYVESFSAARSKAVGAIPRNSSVIMSHTSWESGEIFKFIAAESAAQGSRLVVAQHGGGYGMFRFHACERHEKRLADSYMVWGWADGNPVCHNLPDPRVSRLLYVRRESKEPSDKRVLFVTTSHPRYLYRFHSSPVGTQWEEYYDWELRFLSAISPAIRASIVFRSYMYEFGHSARARISERFPDVCWDDGRPLHSRLKNSRIAIFDNSATTFLESLVANVPTLLFWDPQRWEVRAEAESYFDALRQAEILHDSPESAALKLMQVYDSPAGWWLSEDVQRARQSFVERFALARENWIEYWVKQLRNEISLSRIS
jgi:putative transferase (TIGR04331 family)